MSQELVQVKKQLTFQEICPLWYRQLTNGLENDKLNMIKTQFCVVGEAHGFDDKYTESCRDCYGFSTGVKNVDGVVVFCPSFISVRNAKNIYTPEELNNHATVCEFVKHFNECHVTLTGPDPL